MHHFVQNQEIAINRNRQLCVNRRFPTPDLSRIRPTNRHLQHLWGLRYIDEVIWHREDANGDEDFVDGGDARWWHLTDTQFSTLAILDDGANLQERKTGQVR